MLQSDGAGLANWADAANPHSAFSAKFDANYSIPSGSLVLLRFLTEDYDDDNAFSDTSFFAPSDGLYHFDSQVLWNTMTSSSGYNHLLIRVNNVTFTESVIPNSTVTFNTNRLSCNIMLKKGDKVTVHTAQTTGSSQTLVFTSDNRFMGYKIY